ncbi:MAG: hypothetical protein J7L69_00395 [Desulfobulbaceae bacterium]|nr:hypothetical protein [Desulfobulbaceae bacterium]
MHETLVLFLFEKISGFLVIVPILAGAMGSYSVAAMAGVCALAYAIGSVIRYNIVHAEPVLAGKPSEVTLSLERASDFALVAAYIISVCLYLHILSSFVLGSLNLDTELNENILTTGVIGVIMLIGLTKGLDALGILEKWALYITLLIIVLLIAGFANYDWVAWKSASCISLFKASPHTPWEMLTIVAGTLIVVQGFETPRYLGDEFEAGVRVKASRLSQIISTCVYLVFIAVAMPLVHTLNGHYNDNSLIKLAGVATSLLIAPLVIAAALSQFSAAVADTIAAIGNMEEITHKQMKKKWGTLLVGSGAIVLAWEASTLEIVAIASRAFAFYYMLQCLVAITVSKSTGQRIAMAAIALVLAFITICAVPAT